MSFELNKIAGAILGTLLLVMGLGFLAEAIYAPIEGRGPGYALPEPEANDHGAEVEIVEATPLPVLLASASAEDGASAARKCASCHNFGEGDGNKTGPGLYDIVGRQIAGHGGFSYSDALIAYGAEHGDWTFETLAAFIHDPRGDVPGTKMTFAGIRDEEELADILAYLQTLSAAPVAFPEESAEMTAEEPMADEAMAEEPMVDDHADEPTTDAPMTDTPVPDEPMAEEPVEPEDTVAEDAMAEDETVMEEEPIVEEVMASDSSTLEMAIAGASLEDGASAIRACRACHDWTEDGRNKVGPLLYDVVGRDIGTAPDYSYSGAMMAFAQENGAWSYELLDQFIADPRGTVPGTKMTFGGVQDAEDRAAILALLRTESANPAPLAGTE